MTTSRPDSPTPESAPTPAIDPEPATDPEPGSDLMPRFDLIGLVTTDLPAALAFYRRLGLDIPAGAEAEPHVEVALPGGPRLAWDTVATIHSFDPDWSPPTGGSRIALAFDCGRPDRVDAVHADLVAAGATDHLAPFDAVWGQRYAVVLDPDGNAVDLFARL